MLVLSRKAEQSIIIDADGGEIKVSVLKIDGQRVKLGIEAPPNISIQREEIQLRIAREFADSRALPVG